MVLRLTAPVALGVVAVAGLVWLFAFWPRRQP